MSPILFALCLNDLHSYLSSRCVNGITVNENSDELLVYLRSLVLVYVDETVLFSNSELDFSTIWMCFRHTVETGQPFHRKLIQLQNEKW